MLAREQIIDELIGAYEFRQDYTAEGDDKDFWDGVIHAYKMVLEKDNE